MGAAGEPASSLVWPGASKEEAGRVSVSSHVAVGANRQAGGAEALASLSAASKDGKSGLPSTRENGVDGVEGVPSSLPSTREDGVEGVPSSLPSTREDGVEGASSSLPSMDKMENLLWDREDGVDDKEEGVKTSSGSSARLAEMAADGTAAEACDGVALAATVRVVLV